MLDVRAFPRRRQLSMACLAVFLCLVLVLVPLRCDAVTVSAPSQDSAQIPLSPMENVGGVSAQSAILIDAASGQVLYEKNAQTRLPMASTTKIMTALCAVGLADTADVIAVDAKAVGIEGSSVYLYEGEQLTLEQLLYALLLESANDAAAAIAIALCGSIEAFAEQMNKKAEQLGLENTHFENPHGLDSEQHYTTAHDLALIARAALQHPTIRRIVSTKKITIPLNGTEGTRLLLNHNKLLRLYDGAIGVKTGFTKRSGRCLVSAAERDGLTLIAVTLNAPDDWDDHARMLDAGFAAFERVTLCDQNEFETLLPVAGGKEGYVIVRNAMPLGMTLPRSRSSMQCTVELPRFVFATISANVPVGQLIFRCDTDGDGQAETLASVPLHTAYAVERRPATAWWKRLFSFGKTT